MHTLGKVLAVIAFLLTCGAFYLTPQVLQVRNEWLREVNEVRQTYEETAPKVGQTRKELRETRSEYEQLVQLWAPMIGANVAISPNGQDSIVMNGIGPASGIRENQVIHVFGPAQGGGSNYIGPFKVNLVQAGRSGAVANWPLRQSERQNWAQQFIFGDQSRIYGSVPTHGPETLLRYSQLLLSKDELLAAKTDLRDVRTREVDVANEHLTYRKNELHGDPALQADRGALPDHVIDGLVKAIEDLDEERNATALEVDQLRHQLEDMHERVLQLQDSNRQLARTLPEPKASSDAASSTASQ